MLLQTFTLLFFLNMYCLSWLTGVLHAAFCGHVRGKRDNLDTVLSEKLMCTRAVQDGRMKNTVGVFSEGPLGEAQKTSLGDLCKIEANYLSLVSRVDPMKNLQLIGYSTLVNPQLSGIPFSFKRREH